MEARAIRWKKDTTLIAYIRIVNNKSSFISEKWQQKNRNVTCNTKSSLDPQVKTERTGELQLLRQFPGIPRELMRLTTSEQIPF